MTSLWSWYRRKVAEAGVDAAEPPDQAMARASAESARRDAAARDHRRRLADGDLNPVVDALAEIRGDVRTIKSWVLFFGVLAILSLIGGCLTVMGVFR